MISEKSIIGDVILDPSLANALLTELDPEVFSHDMARTAFLTIRELTAQKEAINLHSITQAAPMSEHEGGLDFIRSCLPHAKPKKFGEHLETIRKNAIQNIQQGKIDELKQISLKRDPSVDEIRMILQGIEFARLKYETADNSLSAHVQKALKEARKMNVMDVEILGIPTPWSHMNKGMEGWTPGLHFFGGLPGHGKTYFLVATALHAGLSGYPGEIISLEMDAIQLAYRFMSFGTAISDRLIRKGAIYTERDWQRLEAFAEQMKKVNVSIEDSISSEIDEVIDHMIASYYKGKRWFMIDYMTLLTSRHHKNKRDEVAHAVQQLFNFQRKYKAAIIIASQVKREVETRDNPRPLASDLAWSSTIEQAAYAVFTLYRPEALGRKTDSDGSPYPPGYMEIIQRKHRGVGKQGTYPLKSGDGGMPVEYDPHEHFLPDMHPDVM